ncbi:MAG: hypothetical protein RLZZ381_2218 [Cyanobacteriota bacterium]|jgi:hypothetical protein
MLCAINWDLKPRLIKAYSLELIAGAKPLYSKIAVTIELATIGAVIARKIRLLKDTG